MNARATTARLTLIALALALLATMLAPETSARGHRVWAAVDESFEVNGRIFGAGSVSVREVVSYTPSLTINEVWVGDECLGLLLAARTAATGNSRGDSMIFERDPRGHLVLVGFVYRGESTRELLHFRVLSDGGHWLSPQDARDARATMLEAPALTSPRTHDARSG